MSRNRLLFIDDDKDVGDVFVEIASDMGFDAVHETDFKTFKTRVAEWRPSVIFTDLQMPEVDGMALIRYLAEIGCRSKIVIVSGIGLKIIELTEFVARELGLDVIGHITKPFKIDDFLRLLSDLERSNPLEPESLVRALRHGEIDVHFQPKCAMTGGDAVGAEALLRWSHPKHGLVRPDLLVAMAEKHGLADSLLDQVFGKVVENVAIWRRAGVDVNVAVNITPANVGNLSLPDRLEALCGRHECSTAGITLELTESTSMDSGADIIEVLARLRIKGFRLSIDDFGTGFSSLARLRQLPFSELKIDQSFVRGIRESHDSAVIVKTMILMAHNLSLNCVAEGVETEDVAALLRQWGCDIGQGYLYAKAMPANKFLAWFQDRIADRLAPIAVAS
jgi:EAL domain-containing protein (putative c-di-GMP-specific phosphodiesterase class I)